MHFVLKSHLQNGLSVVLHARLAMPLFPLVRFYLGVHDEYAVVSAKIDSGSSMYIFAVVLAVVQNVDILA